MTIGAIPPMFYAGAVAVEAGIMSLVLGQAGDPPATGPWWAAWSPAAVFGGLVLLLGGIERLVREQRESRKEAREAAAELKQKVEDATSAVGVKVMGVEKYVDGMNTELLQEIKGLKERVADLSQRESDRKAAVAAADTVAAKLAVTAEVAAAKQEAADAADAAKKDAE